MTMTTGYVEHVYQSVKQVVIIRCWWNIESDRVADDRAVDKLLQRWLDLCHVIHSTVVVLTTDSGDLVPADWLQVSLASNAKRYNTKLEHVELLPRFAHRWSHLQHDYIFQAAPKSVQVFHSQWDQSFPLFWLLTSTTACTIIQAVTATDWALHPLQQTNHSLMCVWTLAVKRLSQLFSALQLLNHVNGETAQEQRLQNNV